MKKTVLILAIACIALVSNVHANNNNSFISNDSSNEVTASLAVNTLCMAIVKGDMDTVKRLIESGKSVNKKSNGMTPAMYAARYNRIDILKYLIENGANLKARSHKGLSAIKYAEAAGSKEAVKIITKALNS